MGIWGLFRLEPRCLYNLVLPVCGEEIKKVFPVRGPSWIIPNNTALSDWVRYTTFGQVQTSAIGSHWIAKLSEYSNEFHAGALKLNLPLFAGVDVAIGAVKAKKSS